MHPDFSAAKIEKSAQITRANTVFPEIRSVHRLKASRNDYTFLCYQLSNIDYF